ncbi:RIIa domain-containing protein 1 [Dendropsophus ebraccatus]|uniref:RIIa domain-containing protein 1 n=1 Tax=Dendropsophus ebraccatus TaxID=150705 RepID=UPI003831D11B
MAEDGDPGALNGEQERRLRDWKIESRISNEEYLRSHREVKLLLSGFLREILLKRPENIREFAADYFTDPTLREKIQEKRSLRDGVTAPPMTQIYSPGRPADDPDIQPGPTRR